MAQRIKAPVALFANAVVLALLGNLAQYGELENAPMWKMMHNPLPDSPLIERPRLAIYVHSGTALRGRRDLQRQVCFPLYKKHNISHHFVVGLPSIDDRQVDGHHQGQLPTEKEGQVGQMLLEEQEQYGDILVTPHRDYYRDLNEKLMGVMRFGVEAGVQYIVKVDDDRCVNVTQVHAMIDKHEEIQQQGKELYGGVHGFRGDEHEMMKGPHGEVAPFMSGQLIILSRGLARIIVGPDWMYNILKVNYGTSSDDANLGKMIARAEEVHNVSVSREYDKDALLCEVSLKRNLTVNMRECQTL